MDARQRWQALQAHLKTSRDCFEARNFAAALASVDAALAIDPDFLAAQSLRDRVLSADPGLLLAHGPTGPVKQPAMVPDIAVVHPDDTAPLVAPAVSAVPPTPRVVADGPQPAAALSAPTVIGSARTGIDAAPALDLDTLKAPRPAAVETVPDLPLAAPRPAASPLPPPSPERPLVSQEGYARFEQRAMRRRADRRLDAARTALARGRLKDAASALDEVISLDPNLPELRDLTARYEQLRRTQSHRPHAGRYIAAAAAFGGIVLGASWLQDATGLRSRQIVAVSPLVAPPEPFGVTVAASEPEPDVTDLAPPAPAATSGSAVAFDRSPAPPVPEMRQPVIERRDDIRPADARAAETLALVPPAATPAVLRPIPEPSGPVAPMTGAAAIPTPPPAASPAPAVAAAAAIVHLPDDDQQIKAVLQRYRSAYEGLDARSARAVWPTVNEAALARAFDGLESQTFTFDDCDVRVRGAEAAAATCRGSARYIPKVGSREPRVEPRTWSFMLKKDGADWKIESARTAR